VAATFGKRHDHILADIRDLNRSDDFRRSNFGPSKYEGENGHLLPCFEMTRDGFTRLVMSFTGDKAGDLDPAGEEPRQDTMLPQSAARDQRQVGFVLVVTTSAC
jgi:Phage regulatory protein Rha (Phage_pRha)